jgi:hypothetical protein
MKRKTSLLSFGPIAALAFLLAVVPLHAQHKESQSDPVLPDDILGAQLIAWSQFQSPQPVQENGAVQQAEPTSQTFTGTVIKDGSTYVLKVSTNTAYPLAEQQKAKPYEGKQVKISGILDANGESLHILSIEPVS